MFSHLESSMEIIGFDEQDNLATWEFNFPDLYNKKFGEAYLITLELLCLMFNIFKKK